MSLFLIGQLAISSSLLSLIWVIQLAHYPFFHFVSKENFSEAMKFHQRSISLIVVPLMILELAFAVYGALTGQRWGLLNLGLVLSIWLTTFLIQVPTHKKLLNFKEEDTIDELVRLNWIRTSLWTLKLIFIFVGVI